MAKIKKKSLEKGRKSFIAWMIVFGVLLIFSYAAFMGIMSKPRKQAGKLAGLQAKKLEEVIDPVCEMKVKPPAEGHVVHKGKTYYFCSESCIEDFKDDPESYVDQEGR